MDYTLEDLTKAISMVKNVEKKEEYIISFTKEDDGLWYVDYPNWPFDHSHLQMVRGADKLCELYSNGKDEVTVEIIASKKKQDLPTQLYDEYVAQDIIIDELHQGRFINSQLDKILYGRIYQKGYTQMWICPVTLFVLGRYPKYIYIKK
jgi:hypothetical protein